MPQTPHEEKICQGIRFYQSRHTQIRQLKRLHSPLGFGFRVWTSCWLLMDYLKTLRLPPGLQVMEVGCGWGLAGIFCAKNLRATVTCVDDDPEVFPFLRLHAELNQVQIATLPKPYENLTSQDLAGIELVIGADICFWDEMLEQLITMIDQALASGVRLILIADPGRSSFAKLCELCEARYGASTVTLSVRKPLPFAGRILRIANQPGVADLATMFHQGH